MTIVEPYPQATLADGRGRTIPAHVTIKHWQLKNLICRDTSNEDRILYCCRHSIRTVDTRTNHVNLLSPKLSFEPRSLASALGYTIAGADNGRIGVIDSQANKTEHNIDGSLVNGIHIYRGHDSVDRALISNNDYSLKFFNLHTMRSESAITCAAAMNHASVTADGSMMAAVGDSTEVYMFVNESGRWRRYTEFTVARDACFSSVFSPSQRSLAIGSQDGTCSIFDVRMLPSGTQDAASCHAPPTAPTSGGGGLLHRSRAARHYPHGSVRAVAWSSSPLDLLVYTESTTFATLLDCRDFSQQQRLRIPDGDGTHFGVHGRDREISGVTWSGNGDHVYVGSEQGITEFAVRTKERRQFPSYRVR